MIVKKVLSIFIILLFGAQISLAQKSTKSLTEKDINEINFRAKRFITEFQELLSLLAEPTIGEFEKNQLMENSFGPASESGNKIFVDEDVIIEDDINPYHINHVTAKNSDSSIKKYLKDFNLFFIKNSYNSISVKDAEVFEIGKKDFVFATVYYKSTLIGKHKNYKQKRYVQTERIATIKAEKEEGIWNFYIVSIVFYNATEHKNILNPDISEIPLELNSKLSLIEKTENSISLNWKNSVNSIYPVSYSLYQGDNLVTKQRDTTKTVNNLEPDTPYSFYIIATEDSTGRVSNKSEIETFTTKKVFTPSLHVNSFSFINIEKTYKKGFIYRIVWKSKYKDANVILELKDNNGKLIQEIEPENNDGYAIWKITDEFDTGKDFQLILYDYNNPSNCTVSKTFKIK